MPLICVYLHIVCFALSCEMLWVGVSETSESTQYIHYYYYKTAVLEWCHIYSNITKGHNKS